MESEYIVTRALCECEQGAKTDTPLFRPFMSSLRGKENERICVLLTLLELYNIY